MIFPSSLTSLKRKCTQYWPQEFGLPTNFGYGIEVTLKSNEVNETYDEKKISIKKVTYLKFINLAHCSTKD